MSMTFVVFKNLMEYLIVYHNLDHFNFNYFNVISQVQAYGIQFWAVIIA